jgi:hypothetical protein
MPTHLLGAALGVVAVAATCLLPAIAAGPLAPFAPTFTGDSTLDLPEGPGVFVVTDTQADITWSLPPQATGWDVRDVRFAYDPSTDTAYLSMRAACTFGDAVSTHSLLLLRMCT